LVGIVWFGSGGGCLADYCLSWLLCDGKEILLDEGAAYTYTIFPSPRSYLSTAFHTRTYLPRLVKAEVRRQPSPPPRPKSKSQARPPAELYRRMWQITRITLQACSCSVVLQALSTGSRWGNGMTICTQILSRKD